MRSSVQWCLLLTALCLTSLTPLLAFAQEIPSPPAATQQPPPNMKMRVVINPDGSASLVSDENAPPATANTGIPNIPPGVILPSFNSDSGLVPVWMVEKDRKEKEEEENRKQREFEAAELEKIKQAKEAEAKAAAEAAEAEKAAAAAATTAAAEAKAAEKAEQQRLRDEADRLREEELRQQQAEAPEELDDEVAELLRQSSFPSEDSPPSPSDGEASSGQEAEHERIERESREQQSRDQQRQAEEQQKQQQQQQQQDSQQQQQHQQDQQSSDNPEAAQRAQEESDAIAAAAARAFAEQGLVKVEEGANQVGMHDPAQALFDSLQRSAFFRELAPHNAWSYVQQNRPFFLLLLCRCEKDDDLDIPTIENLLVDQGLHHKFSFLWAQSPTTEQFQMWNTYGITPGVPAIVIDNIPIGQHVEKYVFSDSIVRPHKTTPQRIAEFASQFYQAPSPLPLAIRSQPIPENQPDLDRDRGKVFSAVGENYKQMVLDSGYSVLLMLYSPTCPGCQAAAPVLDAVAESLAWKDRNIIVVKMDRTQNDVSNVLRFASYPALFLYVSGMKIYDSTTDGGEEVQARGKMGSRGYRTPIDYFGVGENPRQPGQCNAPLNAQDVEAWVLKHVQGEKLLGFSDSGMGSQQAQQQSSQLSDAEIAAAEQQQLDILEQQRAQKQAEEEARRAEQESTPPQVTEAHSTQQGGAAF